MKKNRPWSVIFLLLGLIPGQALAEYTVTINNEDNKPVEVYPGKHQCIHHPEYFNKTVKSKQTIQVHAKWISACNNKYIEVCRRDTGKCSIEGGDDMDDKNLVLTGDGRVISTRK